MKQNLLVVKLYDDTIIWAKEWKFGTGCLLLKNTKTVHKKKNPVYVEDEVKVSNDAIRVWFKILHGEKGK